MTRRALGAVSGWGKSWTAQALWERWIEDFGASVLLDYKDEYAGLVEAGYAVRLLVGPREMNWSVADWRKVIEANEHLVLARHRLGDDQWREAAARIVEASRELSSEDVFDGVLVGIDECQIVAPQQGSLPDSIEYLATTGRGEGAASVWIFQRPSMVEKNVLTQADETMFGAFRKSQDRDQLDVEYNDDVHNPDVSRVSGLTEELHAVDDGPVALRRFKDDDGSLIGSEWIYADIDGTVERRDTRRLSMESTHYGGEAKELHDPEF